jgi:phenylpropionate dioxygenase-like ring-hydroxylating dioxygenase large terminal subunit
MASLLDDAAVAARVLAHVAAHSTDESAACWREPAEHYRRPERLALEREALRRFPAPFCPSAALPEPGSFLAREAAGRPLLAVRGRDGAVRAFHNVCRHRGMALAEGGGCAQAFVCRYHGWTYGLDGALRHVPHAHGFPGLEPAQRGLVPVRAFERGGVVFVNQDPAGAHDDALGALPELIGGTQRVFAAREIVVPANWKIFLEGFLEGYHIKPAHPETFYPYGYDNLNLVETFGRNSRVTFPFRRIEKLAALPAAERRVEGAVTFVTQLFPNGVVVLLSHHTTFVVLEPLSPGETRVHTWALANRPDGEPNAAEAAARDADFVNRTGGAEDAAIAVAIQRGLASPANDAFWFGRFEGALAHFHRSLDALLAEAV